MELIRIYINLTNKCNADCEFCCMWSESSKTTFISFDKFKEIIDSYDDDFELQLEGGEPLLHKDLYLFIEYAQSTNRCKKIIIVTNGILLKRHIHRLVELHKWYKTPVLIKISINYWLYNMNKNCIDEAKDLHLSTEFIKDFNIILNVRLRKKDDWLKKLIKEKDLEKISNLYYLQRYGKYENESEYDLPVIVQNVDDWYIYSCDGKNFKQDLIARSNYERGLK